MNDREDLDYSGLYTDPQGPYPNESPAEAAPGALLGK
jgi:hypothetical protein